MGDPSSSGAQVKDGDELIEIQTGQLGFKTISGENKVKLLPSPWPSESPPISTASLLSVASSQGILAAAGPDTLVITSTDGVREALSAREGDKVRDITPIVTIAHDRLTHVAFSSDESVLVVTGPSTGGLIAYEVEKLKAGQNEVALRIHANVSLRALVPNPNAQSAHLFATVNTEGELSIADLSIGNFVSGSDGIVLAKGVASVAWSNRGKQLVAGTAAGTAVQLKPDGTVVSHIPKSTSVPDDSHVSTVSWLEDNTFFIIYTPNSTSADEGIPISEYYLVERSEKTNFTFHRLPEILPLFGVERLPTHHFIARLRKFDPHVTDLLLLSATTATDIGIVSKSSQPLSASDDPAEQITNRFTSTTLEDDTRRAALPLSEAESLDTSPIGMALDLSSKEPVINPLPSDPEIQETVGPVPNLLILNNEGLLCSWWVIYTDSIKLKTTYSGFDTLKTIEQVRSAVSSPGSDEADTITSDSTSKAAAVPAASPFSQATSAAQPAPFGVSAGQPAFTAPKLQSPQISAFGTGSGFGTTSQIGANKPSWTSQGFGSASSTTNAGSAFGQSGFGQPAFGAPSSIGGSNTPAFGSTTAFGNRPAAFGQPASPAANRTQAPSAFSSTPFSSATSTANSGSGFASFANSSGFGAASDKKDHNNQSPFAKPAVGGGFSSFATAGGFGSAPSSQNENKESAFEKPTSTGFGGFAQNSASQSPFGKVTGSGAFGQTSANGVFGSSQGFGGLGNAANDNKGAFGTATPFKLDSTFKGDGTAKDDLPAPTGSGGFGFGSGLGNLLGEAKKDTSPVQNTEAEMDDGEDQESVSDDEKEVPITRFSPEDKPNKEAPKFFTTPPSTITQPKTTPAAPVSSLFGPPQAQATTTPQQPFSGFSFTSTTPQETPAASRGLFGANPLTGAATANAKQSEPEAKPFFRMTADGSKQPTTDTSKAQENDNSSEATKSLASGKDSNSKSIPEPPLPPDPVSKPDYATGDTSSSSAESKVTKEPDDAPLPPDFLPANKSATMEPAAPELPDDDEGDDDDDFSSDFEDSGEDVTQDISTVEEPDDLPEEADDLPEDEDTTTEQIQTSPESSFKAGDTTSPTGGLFTKVSANDISRQSRPLFGGTNDGPKPSRPLFGEVGQSMPMFPPPKPQQSPRSPSPVRPIFARDAVRSDSRSVSAPLSQQSAIGQRKAEYSQSPIASQAAKARQEEALRERARLEAIKLQNQQIQVQELQTLEDDEDDRIQKELASPVKPSEVLDEFITYQAESHHQSGKPDIPAQIERLYQDINSMICTMGINARSLSAFMMYQKEQGKVSSWPDILRSDAPLDALNEEWPLADIRRLHEGSNLLLEEVEDNQIQGVPQKLESCQALLTRDLTDLRTKLTAIRKSLHARTNGAVATAPLSAEQASIQHDLRKASASVQTKLVQLEDTLGVIRARLAEIVPPAESDRVHGQNVQKKPTVEAVTNTIAKMTSMAEKKSADIDVLEAQLKRLDVSLSTSRNGGGQPAGFTTPPRNRNSRSIGTPGSTTSSVFYTPDSKVGASARSSRSTSGVGMSTSMISAEDKKRWQARLRRKKEVAATLKAVLNEKRTKSTASA